MFVIGAHFLDKHIKMDKHIQALKTLQIRQNSSGPKHTKYPQKKNLK